MSGRNLAAARKRALRATILVTLLSCLIGSASASAVPRDFFGVMPQTALTSQDYDLMGDARVGTLRFEIPWGAVDPTEAPNDYQFAVPDAQMTAMAQQGIHPLPFLFTTPKWAAELDGAKCRSKCAIYAPRTKPGLAAWKDFVTAVVERYSAGGTFWQQNPSLPENPITEWQIWNEQNSPSFYGPKPDPGAYAKLLKASHSAIDAADPSAEVIVGGMFGTPRQGRPPAMEAWEYLDDLYAIKGLKRSFDGVGVHPYAGSMKKVIGQVDLMRESIVNGRDPNADIWVTEMGAASSGVNNPLVKGSRGQAKRLREIFDYLLDNRGKLNVQTMIWYSWRDTDPDVTPCEWCAGSGLVTETLGKKPAYDAFVEYTGGS